MRNRARLMSSQEVARKLRVSAKTVRELIRDGELWGFQLGREWRVPEAKFYEFVNRDGVLIRPGDPWPVLYVPKELLSRVGVTDIRQVYNLLEAGTLAGFKIRREWRVPRFCVASLMGYEVA